MTSQSRSDPDTAMYLCISSPSKANILQDDLLKLEQWEKDWDMNFNPTKCQVLHVTKLKTTIHSKFFLHNTELEGVSAAKYLGVTISDDLIWEKHIDNITNKANQTLENQTLPVHPFNALIFPILRDCWQSVCIFLSLIALPLRYFIIGH